MLVQTSARGGNTTYQFNHDTKTNIYQIRLLLEQLLKRNHFQTTGPDLNEGEAPTTVIIEQRCLQKKEEVSLASSSPMSPGKSRPLAIEDEQTRKKQKLEEIQTSIPKPPSFSEPKTTQRCRERTYSHWPSTHENLIQQLIDAGFFGCNVADRTICIYCNLICQEWDSLDDPHEIHRLCSPNCPFLSLMMTTNENPVEDPMETDVADARIHSSDFSEPARREQSFESVRDKFGSRIEELVKAGFFYSVTDSLVKCFSCDQVLLEWENVKDVFVYHSDQSPECPYVRGKFTHHGNQGEPTVRNTNRIRSTRARNVRRDLNVRRIDESYLNRMVAARLDLPVSQDLLNRNFRLAIIRRVWEDQLRLKNDDFVDDVDVHMACHILQKQIDIINGNKNNIVIPKKKKEEILRRDAATAEEPVVSVNIPPVPTTQVEEVKPVIPKKEEEKNESLGPIEHPCLVCKKAEKQLACIPCGHLTACLTCSQGIRTCPVCRKDIEAYVRVYL